MNYIGSKKSLLNFIYNSVTNTVNKNEGVFCDLFAGTGIVGSMFRECGYEVISNDLQYYSYVLNKHYIENSENDLDLSVIKELNTLSGIDGFIYNNYCMGSGSERNYFTDFNGRKCDAIRTKIEELYLNGDISESNYFFYLGSLLESIDKVANSASVYGAFLKDMKYPANLNFNFTPLSIISGKKGVVYNEDACKLIENISGNVLYLDPPYNQRQYGTNYHLLETIAKYDNPSIHGVTGLRDDIDKSTFCSKLTVKNSFDTIIKNANFKYIFISYNNEGLLSTEELKEILENYGEYKLFKQPYKKFKSNSKVETIEDIDLWGNKYEKIIKKSTPGIVYEYLHCLIK